MDTFFERLEFPSIWLDEGLYPEALRAEQEALLSKEPPIPQKVCGSEHYRYAAFCYYVKDPATPSEVLERLIFVAEKDSDPVMAQAAIIDISSHPNCTADVFKNAKAAFGRFPEAYFDSSLLDRAFNEKLPSWVEV